MMVNLLTYYIKSGDAGTQEVILCFKNQAGSGSFIDVRLQCDNRDAFLPLLKSQFKTLVPDSNDSYKVYSAPGQTLKDFRMGG